MWYQHNLEKYFNNMCNKFMAFLTKKDCSAFYLDIFLVKIVQIERKVWSVSFLEVQHQYLVELCDHILGEISREMDISHKH